MYVLFAQSPYSLATVTPIALDRKLAKMRHGVRLHRTCGQTVYPHTPIHVPIRDFFNRPMEIKRGKWPCNCCYFYLFLYVPWGFKSVWTFNYNKAALQGENLTRSNFVEPYHKLYTTVQITTLEERDQGQTTYVEHSTNPYRVLEMRMSMGGAEVSEIAIELCGCLYEECRLSDRFSIGFYRKFGSIVSTWVF